VSNVAKNRRIPTDLVDWDSSLDFVAGAGPVKKRRGVAQNAPLETDRFLIPHKTAAPDLSVGLAVFVAGADNSDIAQLYDVHEMQY